MKQLWIKIIVQGLCFKYEIAGSGEYFIRFTRDEQLLDDSRWYPVDTGFCEGFKTVEDAQRWLDKFDSDLKAKWVECELNEKME